MVRPRTGNPATWASVVAVALGTSCRFGIADAVVPSAGCHRGKGAPTAGGWRNVFVDDFEGVERRFWLVALAPPPALRFVPRPLLLAFHGQGWDAAQLSADRRYAELGEDAGLVVAYPQGMDDGPKGTGWNEGSAGDGTTCTAAVDRGETGCYRSCEKLGLCGRCSWATCYDDVLFTRGVLRTLLDEYCIDAARVYVAGESNGGVLAHYLAHRMPGTFAAIAAIYALPLLGYVAGAPSRAALSSAGLRSTSLLQLSARDDTIIPLAGGVSSQGWIFEPRAKVQGQWAGVHGCDFPPGPAQFNFSGAPSDMECEEYSGCSTGRGIIACTYEGNHADWPANSEGEQFVLWFLLQFSRDRAPDDPRSDTFAPDPGSSVLVVLDLRSFIALVVFVVLGASVGGATVAAILARGWSPPPSDTHDLDMYGYLGGGGDMRLPAKWGG